MVARHIAGNRAEPGACPGKSLPEVPVLAGDVSDIEPSGPEYDGTPNDAAVNGECGQTSEYRKHVGRNRPLFVRHDIATRRHAHPAAAPRVDVRLRFYRPMPGIEGIGENRVVGVEEQQPRSGGRRYSIVPRGRNAAR